MVNAGTAQFKKTHEADAYEAAEARMSVGTGLSQHHVKNWGQKLQLQWQGDSSLDFL